jgi:hypothetical protein
MVGRAALEIVTDIDVPYETAGICSANSLSTLCAGIVALRALVLASLALWREARVKQSARANLNDAFILESLCDRRSTPNLVLSAEVAMRRGAEERLRDSESNEAAGIGTFIIGVQAGLVF